MWPTEADLREMKMQKVPVDKRIPSLFLFWGDISVGYILFFFLLFTHPPTTHAQHFKSYTNIDVQQFGRIENDEDYAIVVDYRR